MMINLKDVTCIQIGNVMLGIKDIEKISILMVGFGLRLMAI